MRRCELLGDHLTADRFEVLPAPSASDALRLCRYNQPDLLLLDLGLPDAPGLDVLREIRDATGSGPLRPAAAGDRPHRPRRRGTTGCGASRPEPTTIWSSRSTTRSCGPGSAPCCGGARRRAEGPSGSARSSSTRRRRSVTVGDRQVELANKEFALLRALAAEPAPGLHEGRAPARRLGLSVAGANPDPRFTRQPAAPKLDPEGARYVFNCWGVGYRLLDS